MQYFHQKHVPYGFKNSRSTEKPPSNDIIIERIS